MNLYMSTGRSGLDEPESLAWEGEVRGAGGLWGSNWSDLGLALTGVWALAAVSVAVGGAPWFAGAARGSETTSASACPSSGGGSLGFSAPPLAVPPLPALALALGTSPFGSLRFAWVPSITMLFRFRFLLINFSRFLMEIAGRLCLFTNSLAMASALSCL